VKPPSIIQNRSSRRKEALASGGLSIPASRPCERLAFSLTELLVVIAAFALLAATQLPALSRAKAPVSFTRCMSTVRQIGQATLLYKEENNDTFPLGLKTYGAASVDRPGGWPRLLLDYMGGYTSNSTALLCPNEKQVAGTNYDSGQPFPFQLHFMANVFIITLYETNDGGWKDTPLRGTDVIKPSIYWMFGEKNPYDNGTFTPGALQQLYLTPWNDPSADTHSMRRHNGGETTVAADGHGEWLRMPPYQPWQPPPGNFVELGNAVTGSQGSPRVNWSTNGPRVKLYTRYSYNGVF
jgi:prepilin-type N-terminal cleavage/methylation domain-containing protein